VIVRNEISVESQEIRAEKLLFLWLCWENLIYFCCLLSVFWGDLLFEVFSIFYFWEVGVVHPNEIYTWCKNVKFVT